jgi:hypothetical protein
MLKAFRTSVIIPCVALALSALALQATEVKSEKFSIPFEFQVAKQTMPAGEYRVQQATGSNVVVLVNAKTGKQVEFIRSANMHDEGRAKLVFEDIDGRRSLTRIL